MFFLTLMMWWISIVSVLVVFETANAIN